MDWIGLVWIDQNHLWQGGGEIGLHWIALDRMFILW